MDSSPVDEAWETVTEGGDVAPSDPPPSSQDHRSPLQIVADLRHPHLIVMRRNADGPGFEPDIAGGMSLAELSRSEAGWFPLPLRVGLRILLDALSGLAAVHQATKNGKPIDFVHGEVAPSNIIVGRDGLGRLVPVLPAHLSESAPSNPDVTGYIAPERLLGDVFGQPADVFSAGVLLWEAITGKPLFRNWPLDAIVTQLIGRKVPYPIPFGDALWGVPLADVAMRALAVDPAERWPHVGALGAQIENIARGHLATSDEIAALVAGFAAGRGRSSAPPAVIVEAAPAPAAEVVTSLSPTASSIPSPPESRSTAPVEVPAPEPAMERWQTVPPSAPPRVWLPTDERIATERSAVAPEAAESWSGIAPAPPGAMSSRAKVLLWAAVSAGVAITCLVAYRVVDRSHEARTTATVLAPKSGPHGAASGAHTTAEAPKAPAPLPPAAAATAAGADPTPGIESPAGKSSESAAPAGMPAVPTSVAGSTPTAAPPAIVNRPAPRPAPRPAAPPAAPKVAPPPPPAATPAPPPAPKPKPKEDIFGI